MNIFTSIVLILTINSISANTILIGNRFDKLTLNDRIGSPLVRNIDNVIGEVEKPEANASLKSVLAGLLHNVSEITCTFTTIVGSLGPTLNQLTSVISTVFKTVADIVDTLLDSLDSVTDGVTIFNVEGAIIELIQTVNFVVESASELIENLDRLLCSIDHIALDLAAIVKDLGNTVITIVEGVRSEAEHEAVCSIHLVLIYVLAIVDDILRNLAVLIQQVTGSVGTVLTEIAHQVSDALSEVGSTLNDPVNNPECVVSELVVSLSEMFENLSRTVVVLIGNVRGIVGGLNGVLVGLIRNLDGNSQFDEITDKALNLKLGGVIGFIVNAVVNICQIVPESYGLLDAAVYNFEAAAGILLTVIGAITKEAIHSAGRVNGVADNLNFAIIQLTARVQNVVDTVAYLASHLLIAADVADILEKYVIIIVSIANTIISAVNGLLRELVDAISSSSVDISNMINNVLSGITSFLSSNSLVAELSNAMNSSVGEPVTTFLSGTLSGVGSLAGASGSLCGSLYGVTSALSGLTVRLSEIVGISSDSIVPDPLADALHALRLLSTNVDQITHTLTVVLSSLNVLTHC